MKRLLFIPLLLVHIPSAKAGIYIYPYFNKGMEVRCVDNNPNIPNKISSVPTIIVPRMPKPLVGKEAFLKKTDSVFKDDFKGFDFEVGEKRFRYGVKNPNDVIKSKSLLNRKDIKSSLKRANSVRLIQQAPFQGPIYLEVNGSHVAIRKETAKLIEIEISK